MGFPATAAEAAVLLFTLAAAAPLSLHCARAARGEGASAAPDRFRSVAGMAVAGCVCWCFTESALGIIMGAAGLFRESVSAALHFVIFVAGVLLLLRYPARSPAAAPMPLPRALAFILALTFVSAGLFLWNILAWPPVESDTLGYHLPLLIKLIQGGRFAFMGQWDFQEHFPRNWETISAVLSLPLRKDIAALCPNILAFAVFGFSAAALAMRAGASPIRSAAAAFALLMSPIISEHMGSLHIDLPFAAFFLAGFHYALAFAETRSRADWICLCMAGALFVGMRSTGPLYACLLLPALLWPPSPRPVTALPSLPWLAATGLLLSLPGLFWYAYNLIHYGNPLYSVILKVGGHALFPGNYPVDKLSGTSLLRVFHPFHPGQAAILGQEILRRLSLGFLAVSAAALVYLGVTLARPRQALRPRLSALLLLAAAGAFAIYCTTPYSGNYNSTVDYVSANTGAAFRLGFPFLGLWAVLGALGLERLQARDGHLMALASLAFMASHWEAWKVTTAALALACAVAAAYEAPRLRAWAARRPSAAGTSVWSLLLLLFLAGYSAADRQRARNRMKRDYGPAMAFIDTRIDAGAAIAYAGADNGYALFGSGFSHPVIYLAPGPSGLAAWADSLAKSRVAWFAMGPCILCPTDSLSALQAYVDDASDVFKPVFGGKGPGRLAIYRLERP